MMNDDIKQRNFFKQLQKLDFIEKIILYGSRARGDNKERSDIDLAVVCPQASGNDWHKVLEIIDQADTLLKIDCVRFDELKDSNSLKKSIVRDGVVLYQKEEKK
jgi:uncharacterized protein